MNMLEEIQKIQLNAYNEGKFYQALKEPIHQCPNDRIKLPICKDHEMNILTQFCIKCGMSAMEVYSNENTLQTL